MNLILDIGNTRIKAAVYEEYSLIDLYVFDKEQLLKKIKKICQLHPISNAILSSVVVLDQKTHNELAQCFPLLLLSPDTIVPFKNQYTSPKTLGMDRVALVAAAVNRFPNKPVLVIDAGTCITYDFVTSDSVYKGGAISPGIQMRYKALHQFTSKLPLLSPKTVDVSIGDSTEKSIHLGNVQGVLYEIEGVIADYQLQYQDLTTVLTGGDAFFLAKQLKSSIFAIPNFILEGLQTILIYNLD